MSTEIATIAPPRASVLVAMAQRYSMEPAAFEQTLRGTVVPAGCSKEQFAAFLLVAKEYKLNPITKEIFAFPTGGGGIQPIVSIDGWMNLINSHPQMDGLEFVDHRDDAGKITAITARIWRKDRTRQIEVTEYMSECVRNTPTWKQWPTRMLRHKAAIQAARYAFGFSGIQDPDEFERMTEMRPTNGRNGAGPPLAAQEVSPGVATRRAGPPPTPPPAAGPPPSAPPAAEVIDIEPEDEAIDEGGYLSHLEDELGACTDRETLVEVWAAHEDMADRLSADARKRADGLHAAASKRIGQ